MSGISKREQIKKAYPHSKTWSAKVDKMSDSQATAIFLSMQKKRQI
jgi:hypothetical protein